MEKEKQRQAKLFYCRKCSGCKDTARKNFFRRSAVKRIWVLSWDFRLTAFLERQVFWGSFFTNVPAASFFGGSAGSSGPGDVSGNVVTSENFSEVLSQNIVVDEVLLDGNTDPPADRTFTTQFNIRDNTERVTIQGLQHLGAPAPEMSTPSRVQIKLFLMKIFL